jgi:hypothetical protein
LEGNNTTTWTTLEFVTFYKPIPKGGDYMPLITLLIGAWRWFKSVEISLTGKWKIRIAFNKPQKDQSVLEAQGKIKA